MSYKKRRFSLSERRNYWMAAGAQLTKSDSGRGFLNYLFQKKESSSFRNGLKKGDSIASKRKSANEVKFHTHKKSSSLPPSGAYNSRGRIKSNCVDDLHGPVVFW